MNLLLISFWAVFGALAVIDQKESPELSSRHGVPLWMLVLFAGLGFLLSPLYFLVGLILGAVVHYFKVFKWADAFIVAGMSAGIGAMGANVLETLNMTVLGVAVLLMVLATVIKRVKKPVAVTPYAFIVGLVFAGLVEVVGA